MNSELLLPQPLAQSCGIGLPLWKRGLDLLLLVILLPAILLLSAAVFVIIKMISPGTVLFRQRRIGYKGNEFTIYKFRTMHVDADIAAHRHHARNVIVSGRPMVKLDNESDPRIFPFGAFLRASGLDELPQFINILRGEMSIVGPRPCLPYEYEFYGEWERRRFDAVPGLTGLWQVSGKNRTTFNEMINLDIEYGERKTLFLDLAIISKTFRAVWQQCLQLRGGRGRSIPIANVAKRMQLSN